MSIRNAVLFVAVGWVSVACARTPPTRGAAPHWQRDTVVVAVHNQNYYDANVFAEYEGFITRRLGTVSGFNSATYRLAWQSAPLRMRMQLIGAGGGVSNELLVNPGDTLELYIEPDAHRRFRRGR